MGVADGPGADAIKLFFRFPAKKSTDVTSNDITSNYWLAVCGWLGKVRTLLASVGLTREY